MMSAGKHLAWISLELAPFVVYLYVHLHMRRQSVLTCASERQGLLRLGICLGSSFPYQGVVHYCVLAERAEH